MKRHAVAVDCSSRQQGDNRKRRNKRKEDGELKEAKATAMFISSRRDVSTS